MVGLERIRDTGVARDAGSSLPSHGLPRGDRQAGRRAGNDAVVRPLGRVVERPCARPSCSTPARATLRFSYADREASIERLAEQPAPQTYDLCAIHAARTRPPHGWTLRDRRPEDERRPDAPPQPPVDLGGDRTVAVLAAALRAAPDAVSEDADRADATEVDGVGDDHVAERTGDLRPRPPLAARHVDPPELDGELGVEPPAEAG